MTRYLEVNPTLGLMPARELDSEGETMLPSVSDPRAAQASPIDEETPDPEELPEGSWPG